MTDAPTQAALAVPRPEDRVAITPDGRRLTYTVSGPDDALPIVVHHGTPGSANASQDWLRATAASGLRLVTYERPGYGGSDRRPGRTVADAAQDVAVILDAIGAEVCITEGRSGGGPHALACAALLPDRVLAAASVAGVAPYAADGVGGLSLDAWLAGMGQDNVDEVAATLQGEAVLRAWIEAQLPAMRSADRETVVEAMVTLLPPVDLAALTGEFAQDTVTSFARGLATGPDGWVDDDFAFCNAWGFPLDGFSVPVALWQGAEDLMVPYAHGQWLAATIPGADVHLLSGEGHLSIRVAGPGGVLANLLQLAGR
jgi:pimeloyl-ACP methyl ester carboxylesterase